MLLGTFAKVPEYIMFLRMVALSKKALPKLSGGLQL
jgi:hypothetical protein